MTQRSNSPVSLVSQLAEVWFATPQVMAMRLSRMAVAGANPSAGDRAEMQRMGHEKVMAFSQGWMAMGMRLWLMPLQLAPAFTRALGSTRSAGALQQAATRASTGLLSAGLQPVHRTVTANARRLAGKPLSRTR